MPMMDGIEMIYHWHQQQDNTIPIIVMTNQQETAYPQSVSKVVIKSNTSLKEIIDHISSMLG
jgi:CheY-like chemotaxis protein